MTAYMFTFTYLFDSEKHVMRQLMYSMPPLVPASCFLSCLGLFLCADSFHNSTSFYF